MQCRGVLYVSLALGQIISGFLLFLRWVCHLGKAGDKWAGAGHVIDLTLACDDWAPDKGRVRRVWRHSEAM